MLVANACLQCMASRPLGFATPNRDDKCHNPQLPTPTRNFSKNCVPPLRFRRFAGRKLKRFSRREKASVPEHHSLDLFKVFRLKVMPDRFRKSGEVFLRDCTKKTLCPLAHGQCFAVDALNILILIWVFHASRLDIKTGREFKNAVLMFSAYMCGTQRSRRASKAA